MDRLEFNDQAVQAIKRKEGGLIGLINSEFFTVHMLMGYLHRKDKEGVTDFLINKLYDESIANIDFYIPQLW